jgi:hypothetical protein
MTVGVGHWLSKQKILLEEKTKNAGGLSPASRLNDKVGYLFFSVAMRKATRPSSGTVSSWMLKPLPSACAHALAK